MRRRRDHDTAHPRSTANAPEGILTRAWPYAVLVAIAIAFCGRAIFTGRSLAPLDMLLLMSPWKAYAQQFPGFSHVQTPMLDPVQQYFPWRLFAVASLKDGMIPLWNPYAFAGTPFVANLQSAIFYPPNLLFLVMPVALGFTYTAVLHLALAGCFMFFFLRVWGIHRWPALVAAAAYMLNGYFIAWLEYPAIGLWVAVWLPLLLALYELSLRRRSWLLAGLSGLTVGVLLCGGHLQVAVYVLFAFCLYAVVRAIWRSPGQPNDAAGARWEPLARAAVALALGFALGAGQLLPALELAPLSHRPPISPAAIRNTALPFTHLIMYFVPKFFGSPADYNYWGNLVGRPDINYLETSGYVGVLPLMLACFGIVEWRRPLTRYLLVLAGLSVLLALGTPLYSLFFYAVPGFKQLAGVARILYLTAFALTGLAAIGLDRLVRERMAPTFLILTLFAAIGLGFVGADLVVFRPQIAEFGRIQLEPIASFPRYLHLQIVFFICLLIAGWIVIGARRWMRVGLVGGMCLSIVVLDLFVHWVRFNPAADPRMAFIKTAATTFLRDHINGDRMLSVGTGFLNWMPPNTPMAYSLRDIQGSDSLWWERYFRFLNAVQPCAPTADWENFGSPGLDLVGVRYILSTRPITQPKWELVFDRDSFIYERRAHVTRARLVSKWRVGSPETALAAIAENDPTLADQPIVDSEPGFGQTPGAPAGDTAIVRDGANTVAIRCRAPTPRLLVLSDPDYPGWRADLDGRPVPHLTANYVFRAVEVPAGRHTVTWRYRPGSFQLGLFGGLLGVAALAGMAAAGAVNGSALRGKAGE